jgi:hypothetical protein
VIVLVIIGFILIIIGLIGCVVPGVPGPPFSFLALVLLSAAKRWEPFSLNFLIIMALITIVVTVLDYVVPAAGAKKFGASKFGFWGAIIGMLVGIIFFPPLGIIIGAFLGAIVGEMIVGKQTHDAIKAGWGVFVGVVFGMLLKLVASGVMTFYFMKGLFRF